MNKTLPLIAILTCSGLHAGAAAPLSYADLVQRLTDLEHLATLPAPGETTKQWSSYDRASQYDEATGKYLGWDANGDGHGIIRRENGRQVLAEMDGPGVIWRIWSATPKTGHVRIYLDGVSEPAVDLPFVGYFDRQHPPFTRPSLVYTAARGWNNYTPIPYQKSCKIVADDGWGDYYQFVYTRFAPGTTVPIFTRDLSAADNAALDALDRRLARCGPREPGPGHIVKSGERRLNAHGGNFAEQCKGPAAISLIRIKVADLPAPPADQDVLRELVLQIKWDGQSRASVWAPLGDFFGSAPGRNVYRSFPCGMTRDGWFYANWFMPFARSAEVTLRNEGPQARKVQFEIFTEPLKRPAADYARFHVKWHRDEFLPTAPERWIDWPLLKTWGRGRFAGVMLHVWNPRGSWWGEGDEKFFVDGEKFPSTFGTGSEDYFGYAWCSPQLFQRPFHNQTRNDGNNKGHISVNRWHIADQIPFQQSFDGYLEKYYPNARPTLYAATVFWYLEPDGDDPYAPVALPDRRDYYVQPVRTKKPGVLEGEDLKVLACTAGNPHEQDLIVFGDQWSNDAHLWWVESKPGDRLVLALPVARAGRYQLAARFTKAKDYGIVQLALNGVNLGGPMDFYHPSVIPTDELDLGAHDLVAGENRFTVEITGANAQAVKHYMFGLDYVRLTPAD
jgi:hypothetical protein